MVLLGTRGHPGKLKKSSTMEARFPVRGGGDPTVKLVGGFLDDSRNPAIRLDRARFHNAFGLLMHLEARNAACALSDTRACGNK
jgi:hypothetical protein